MRGLLAPVAVSLAVAACASAGCPSTLTPVTSMRLTGGAPATDVVVLHSAEELLQAATPFAAPPTTESPNQAASGPALPGVPELAKLNELVKKTDFAAFDVAILRAGNGRGRVIGAQNPDSGQMKIFFVSSCPPCGGGDPGSAMIAQAEYQAEQSPGAVLVLVPKRTAVTAKVCGEGCGPCRSDVP